MEAERLAAKFKEKLHKCLPNVKEIQLDADTTHFTLKFAHFTLSVERSTTKALNILFQRGIEVVDAISAHINNLIELKQMKRYESFRMACEGENKNAIQAARASSKVAFVKGTSQKHKQLKESQDLAVKIQQKEKKNSLPDDNSNEVEPKWEDPPFIVEDENENGYSSKKCKIITEQDKNDSIFINDDISTDKITVSSSFVQNVANLSFVTTSPCEDGLNVRVSRLAYLDFMDKVFGHIFLGLLKIRSLDKIIKKASNRELFANNVEILPDEGDLPIKIDGSFREVENSKNFIGLTSYESIPGVYNENLSMVNDNSSFTLESIRPSALLERNKLTDSEDHKIKSKEADMKYNSEDHKIQSTGIDIKSSADFEKQQFMDDTPDSLAVKMDDVTSYPTIPGVPSSDTSIFYDNSEEKISNQIYSSGYRGKHNSMEKMEIPDTQAFKQIVFDCKAIFHSHIEVVRRFCAYYKIFPPEFEIVRENDVFRCTATFLNINFVSSYEYEKLDSKNSSCKKIVEYISRNWVEVFVHK